jgi:uncharacterized membrane protein (UPF0182 family)
VTGGFLYVESIYIQANEARMPQLKKVVLAIGDRLIYRDNFDQALADLTGGAAPPKPAQEAQAAGPPTSPAEESKNAADLAQRVRQIRDQAQQLVQELEKLEKDAGKTK